MTTKAITEQTSWSYHIRDTVVVLMLLGFVPKTDEKAPLKCHLKQPKTFQFSQSGHF